MGSIWASTRLHCERPRLLFEPLKLLSFDFIETPDPAFYCNVDPDPAFYSNADPDPASQNNGDPDPQPCHIIWDSLI